MKKNFSIFFLISVIAISIFFVSTGRKTNAEECNDCPTPTEPGDADYCPVTPILKLDPTNPDEIEAGSSIVIKVLDGGGPFIWGDPGNGYSWANGEVIDADNHKRRKTNERSNTLQCTTGTCGSSFDIVASVEITDNCEVTITTKIRNDVGKWILQDTLVGEVNEGSCSDYLIYGEYAYKICIISGWNSTYNSSCSNPPFNYPANHCYDPDEVGHWTYENQDIFYSGLYDLGKLNPTCCTNKYNECKWVDGGCSSGTYRHFVISRVKLYEFSCP